MATTYIYSRADCLPLAYPAHSRIVLQGATGPMGRIWAVTKLGADDLPGSAIARPPRTPGSLGGMRPIRLAVRTQFLIVSTDTPRCPASTAWLLRLLSGGRSRCSMSSISTATCA